MLSYLILTALTMLFAVLVVDLLSGFVHYTQDNIFKPTTPIIGGWVQDGLHHHKNPDSITYSSPFARSGVFALLVFVIGTVLFSLLPFKLFIMTATFTGMCILEIQALAHRETPPLWARSLQALGIIQSPSQHWKHHEPDHRGTYCVVTSWLNPAVNATGIWRLLDRKFNLAQTDEPATTDA